MPLSPSHLLPPTCTNTLVRSATPRGGPSARAGMSSVARSTYVAGFRRTCCGYRHREASSAGPEVPARHSATGSRIRALHRALQCASCDPGHGGRGTGGLGGKSGKISSPLPPFFTSVGSFTVGDFFFWVALAFATFLPLRKSAVPASSVSSLAGAVPRRRSRLLHFGSTHTPHATPLPGPPPFSPPISPWHYVIHTRTWPGNPETRQPNASHPAFPSHPHLTVPIATSINGGSQTPREREEPRKPEIPPASPYLFHFPSSPAASFETEATSPSCFVFA